MYFCHVHNLVSDSEKQCSSLGYTSNCLRQRLVNKSESSAQETAQETGYCQLPITIAALREIYSQMNINIVVMWAAVLVAFYGFLGKLNVGHESAGNFDGQQHLVKASY